MDSLSDSSCLNSLCTLSLLAIFAFSMGCNTSVDDPISPDDATPISSSSGSTLIILTLENGSLKPTSKANVTAEELETHLASIDWSEPSETQVSLSRGGFENLTILAERTAPDDCIVVWSSMKSGVAKRLKFGPIQPDSAETLQLFLSYLNQDGEYETMVQWSKEIDRDTE